MISIDLDRKKGLAILYLSRTETLNAMDHRFIDEFRRNLLILRRDPDLRVLMIASRSQKAFSTGVDLSILTRFSSTIEARKFALDMERLMEEIFDFPHPTISLVDGYALGGGFGIALSTDIIILSKGARIGFPAVKIGAVLPAGCTYRLIARAGAGRARELLLSGRIIDGEEAYGYGLGEFLVDSGKLMDKGMEVASMLLEGSPFALSLQKSIANALLGEVVRIMSYQSADSFAFLTTTPDWKSRIESKIQEMKQKGGG